MQKEEQENLGKLEFSLDYNFTDAQVLNVLKYLFKKSCNRYRCNDVIVTRNMEHV